MAQEQETLTLNDIFGDVLASYMEKTRLLIAEATSKAKSQEEMDALLAETLTNKVNNSKFESFQAGSDLHKDLFEDLATTVNDSIQNAPEGVVIPIDESFINAISYTMISSMIDHLEKQDITEEEYLFLIQQKRALANNHNEMLAAYTGEPKPSEIAPLLHQRVKPDSYFVEYGSYGEKVGQETYKKLIKNIKSSRIDFAKELKAEFKAIKDSQNRFEQEVTILQNKFGGEEKLLQRANLAQALKGKAKGRTSFVKLLGDDTYLTQTFDQVTEKDPAFAQKSEFMQNMISQGVSPSISDDATFPEEDELTTPYIGDNEIDLGDDGQNTPYVGEDNIDLEDEADNTPQADTQENTPEPEKQEETPSNTQLVETTPGTGMIHTPPADNEPTEKIAEKPKEKKNRSLLGAAAIALLTLGPTLFMAKQSQLENAETATPEKTTPTSDLSVEAEPVETVDIDGVDIPSVTDKTPKVAKDAPTYTDDIEPTSLVYTIEYGDTLHNIAQKFGTSVDDIQDLNPHITNPDNIKAYDDILVPEVDGYSGAYDLQTQIDVNTPSGDYNTLYTIQDGDTLLDIAAEYETHPDLIKYMNPETVRYDGHIQAGDTLKLKTEEKEVITAPIAEPIPSPQPVVEINPNDLTPNFNDGAKDTTVDAEKTHNYHPVPIIRAKLHQPMFPNKSTKTQEPTVDKEETRVKMRPNPVLQGKRNQPRFETIGGDQESKSAEKSNVQHSVPIINAKRHQPLFPNKSATATPEPSVDKEETRVKMRPNPVLQGKRNQPRFETIGADQKTQDINVNKTTRKVHPSPAIRAKLHQHEYRSVDWSKAKESISSLFSGFKSDGSVSHKATGKRYRGKPGVTH